MWDIDSTGVLLREMSAVHEPDKLLRLILAHAQGIFNVRRAIVLSREELEYPQFRVVRYAESGGLRIGTMVDDPDIARTGGLLADLLYAGQFRSMTPLMFDGAEPSKALLDGCRSLVAFPLYDHGESVGMVALLGPSDRICGTSELCGLAIMGALLQRTDRTYALTQQLETTCRTLDAELAAAANVQRWLLPPTAPPIAGVDVASFYRTALHAGGDYYDAGELPDGRYGVLIADVSGHGAAAAVLMAILRTIVHDEVDRTRVVGSAALLDHADNRLCALDLSSRGMFVTAFSGSLDIATGEFTYSCAGHPPPRLVRARDRSITSLAGANAPPLGVLSERPTRTEETIMLDPGDLIVFYSDGIIEARSPAGEFFGITGLDRALCELSEHARPDRAINAIKEAVQSFAGDGAPSDDQTLLAVRWRNRSSA